MNKQQLRKEYLARRQQLTALECAALNRQLLAQFKALDFTAVHHLHIFLPMVIRNEPDTLLIIAWLKQQQPEIKIVYPRVNATDYSMACYADDAALILEAGSWGITEPISGTLISPEKIDMVIVPLLVFDELGYRVGYGKGFYDRFTAQCRPGTQFIGLSFFEPVDKITGTDQYDVQLHACLTPSRRWRW